MKYRLEYAVVKALFVAVRLMPDPLVRAAGTAGVPSTPSIAHRRTAQRNLASAFPAAQNAREGPLRARRLPLAACWSSS